MKNYTKYFDWQENPGYIDPYSVCGGASKATVGSISSTPEASDSKRTKEKHVANKLGLEKFRKIY